MQRLCQNMNRELGAWGPKDMWPCPPLGGRRGASELLNMYPACFPMGQAAGPVGAPSRDGLQLC